MYIYFIWVLRSQDIKKLKWMNSFFKVKCYTHISIRVSELIVDFHRNFFILRFWFFVWVFSVLLKIRTDVIIAILFTLHCLAQIYLSISISYNPSFFSSLWLFNCSVSHCEWDHSSSNLDCGGIFKFNIVMFL